MTLIERVKNLVGWSAITPHSLVTVKNSVSPTLNVYEPRLATVVDMEEPKEDI